MTSSVVVTYQDPRGGDRVELALTDVVRIGRAPGQGGITVDPHDVSVSAVAVVVAPVSGGGAMVENTSSYAQVELIHDSGSRFLFPGEAIQLRGSSTLVVPGSAQSFRVELVVTSGAKPTVSPTGTRPLPGDIELSEERRPALAGLCAARFYPERFGAGLLPASAIARLVAATGEHLTPKAINNKIQRTRDQIAEQHGVYLDTREDLAEFLIRRGLIQRRDVDALLARSGE